MGDFNEAVPGRYGRANDPFNTEQVEADRRAHNIGDRIDRTDFVEVHLFDRTPVNFCFSFGQLLENPFGQILLAKGERAAVNHRRDVVQVAMLVLGFVLNRDLGRAEAFLFDLRANKPAAWETQGIDAGLDVGKLSAGVDECTECHVAADSARAIEIGNSHETLLAVKNECCVDCMAGTSLLLSTTTLTLTLGMATFHRPILRL